MSEGTARRGRRRVVIVGGGFGGLACARALDGEDVDVLLLDRHNFHLFAPLLYQVATALLNPSDIAYPFRSIFRRSRNVRFRQATVVSTDLDAHTLRLAAGDDVAYDDLVIATGSANDYFANQTLAEHTLGMKSLAEALGLRNHILASLELAARSTSPEERAACLTFVVAGGGPTGVEFAGALAELLHLVLGRDYPELRHEDAEVVLVEGTDRLLGQFSPTLGAYAERTLRDRAIDVRTSTFVEKADDDHVVLSSGATIATRTVVWSAGVRPVDPLGDGAPARNRANRVRVDPFLRLEGTSDVHVIGDAAAVQTPEGELPMLSPPAMQEGRYVARAIVARAKGERGEPAPFRYVDKGTMATIGRRSAVADIHGVRLRGSIGWLTWLFVHIYYLIGFRNRAWVLASWGWNYLRMDRPIRLILRGRSDRLTREVDPVE
ncbi:MAG TPA: NAD(P)/FAD-dependent oxidoreductase [Actinomycetota bacterium]|nr:NAD(P)/FAD-dependent oxidoreductase [Actinomycetota bacterium]